MKFKPLAYVGSKYLISDWVISHFPNDNEFKTYVEVFGGGASILFKIINLYGNKKNYVYNDLFFPLVTFFEVLRDEKDFERLIRKIQYTEYSRYLYEKLENFILKFKHGQKLSNKEEEFYSDRVNIAWALYTKLHLNKSGIIRKRIGFDISNKREHRLYNIDYIIKSLNFMAKTIRKATIENLDFADLIIRYDDKHVFFYCDPPYQTPETKKIYGEEINSHELLFNIAKTIKGKILISYFEDGSIVDLYKQEGFFIYKMKRFLNMTNIMNKKGIENKHKTEVLISNYEIKNKQLNLF